MLAQKFDTKILKDKIEETESFIISPKNKIKDPSFLFDQFSAFPTLKQLRKKAWPKISL